MHTQVNKINFRIHRGKTKHPYRPVSVSLSMYSRPQSIQLNVVSMHVCTNVWVYIQLCILLCDTPQIKFLSQQAGLFLTVYCMLTNHYGVFIVLKLKCYTFTQRCTLIYRSTCFSDCYILSYLHFQVCLCTWVGLFTFS